MTTATIAVKLYHRDAMTRKLSVFNTTVRISYVVAGKTDYRDRIDAIRIAKDELAATLPADARYAVETSAIMKVKNSEKRS